MKKLGHFLRTTLVGGVLFVLPAWLAVLLVAKALMHLQVFVKPVSSHLRQDINHPRVLAIVLLVAMCFLVGLVIQTTIGAQAKRIAEQRVLDKVPGYTTLRSFAGQLTEFEKGEGFRPALGVEDEPVPQVVLARIEDAWQIAFLVERLEDGHLAVFVPGAPNPQSGSVYLMTEDRIKPAGIPPAVALKCLTRLGAGSSALLRETPTLGTTHTTKVQ